jgi:hypothetical protein
MKQMNLELEQLEQRMPPGGIGPKGLCSGGGDGSKGYGAEDFVAAGPGRHTPDPGGTVRRES